MTYLIMGTMDTEKLLMCAILHEYFKKNGIVPIESTNQIIGDNIRRPSSDVPKFEAEPRTNTDDYLPRNKKGKIIQDNTPFYNKFARTGHKRK